MSSPWLASPAAGWHKNALLDLPGAISNRYSHQLGCLDEAWPDPNRPAGSCPVDRPWAASSLGHTGRRKTRSEVIPSISQVTSLESWVLFWTKKDDSDGPDMTWHVVIFCVADRSAPTISKLETTYSKLHLWGNYCMCFPLCDHFRTPAESTVPCISFWKTYVQVIHCVILSARVRVRKCLFIFVRLHERSEVPHVSGTVIWWSQKLVQSLGSPTHLQRALLTTAVGPCRSRWFTEVVTQINRFPSVLLKLTGNHQQSIDYQSS